MQTTLIVGWSRDPARDVCTQTTPFTRSLDRDGPGGSVERVNRVIVAEGSRDPEGEGLSSSGPD